MGVFQQGAGQGVLAAVRREPADQKRGGHPAPLQRFSDLRHVILPTQDPVAADPALESRLETWNRPQFWLTPVAYVAQAIGKLGSGALFQRRLPSSVFSYRPQSW
jgi:hypothetical protein